MGILSSMKNLAVFWCEMGYEKIFQRQPSVNKKYSRHTFQRQFRETFGKGYTLEINEKTNPEEYIRDRADIVIPGVISTIVVPRHYNELASSIPFEAEKPYAQGLTAYGQTPKGKILEDALEIKEHFDDKEKGESLLFSGLENRIKDISEFKPGNVFGYGNVTVALNQFYTERMAKTEAYEEAIRDWLTAVRDNKYMDGKEKINTSYILKDAEEEKTKLKVSDDRIAQSSRLLLRSVVGDKGLKGYMKAAEKGYDNLYGMIKNLLGQDKANKLYDILEDARVKDKLSKIQNNRSLVDVESSIAELGILIPNQEDLKHTTYHEKQLVITKPTVRYRNVESFEDLIEYHQSLTQARERYADLFEKKTVAEKLIELRKFALTDSRREKVGIDVEKHEKQTAGYLKAGDVHVQVEQLMQNEYSPDSVLNVLDKWADNTFREAYKMLHHYKENFGPPSDAILTLDKEALRLARLHRNARKGESQKVKNLLKKFSGLYCRIGLVRQLENHS